MADPGATDQAVDLESCIKPGRSWGWGIFHFRNGQTMFGAAEREGDEYVVRLGHDYYWPFSRDGQRLHSQSTNCIVGFEPCEPDDPKVAGMAMAIM